MRQYQDRGRARMGFIVPISNSNLEPDMYRVCPTGVSVHFARAGGYDLDEIPDSEQMSKMADASLEPILQSLVAVRPDIVAYGCTSATLTKGPAYDLEFTERMATISGVPAFTAAGSLCSALSALDLKRVSFASPYTEQLNKDGAQFLTESGFDVVDITYIGSDLGNYGQGNLTPDQVFDLGKKSDCKGAQAIVLSCTDMRAVEVIEPLESELGKPVISSNQAMMYVAAKLLKLESRIPGKLGKT